MENEGGPREIDKVAMNGKTERNCVCCFLPDLTTCIGSCRSLRGCRPRYSSPTEQHSSESTTTIPTPTTIPSAATLPLFPSSQTYRTDNTICPADTSSYPLRCCITITTIQWTIHKSPAAMKMYSKPEVHLGKPNTSSRMPKSLPWPRSQPYASRCCATTLFVYALTSCAVLRKVQDQVSFEEGQRTGSRSCSPLIRM